MENIVKFYYLTPNEFFESDNEGNLTTTIREDINTAYLYFINKSAGIELYKGRQYIASAADFKALINILNELNLEVESKLDKTSPISTGLLEHQGFGDGSNEVVLKIKSNNSYLTGYGDASSAFHFGGVPIAFDVSPQFYSGIDLLQFGADITGNGGGISGFAHGEFNSGSVGRVETGCDFNALPAEDLQNFIVKNKNVSSGSGDNWSYQAFEYNENEGLWNQNFGVKADGTVLSKGKEVSTIEYVNSQFDNVSINAEVRDGVLYL